MSLQIRNKVDIHKIFKTNIFNYNFELQNNFIKLNELIQTKEKIISKQSNIIYIQENKIKQLEKLQMTIIKENREKILKLKKDHEQDIIDRKNYQLAYNLIHFRHY